jgi:hypothetical protein
MWTTAAAALEKHEATAVAAELFQTIMPAYGKKAS